MMIEYQLVKNEKMLAYIHPRPLYCDRGRFHANIEVRGVWRSEVDPWPRYYFKLEHAKIEVEEYLKAKNVDIIGAEWTEYSTV